VLPKEEQDASVLLGMVIRITSVMAIISLTLSVFFGLALIRLDKVPWIILPVITITAFMEALVVIFNCWNIRIKAFALISKAVASAAIATVLFSTGMGLLAVGWLGLALGALLGRIVNLGLQLFYGNRIQIMRDSLETSKQKVLKRRLLKEHADFPKYRLPQNLINAASLNLLSILLVAFFGPVIGGFYALAKRVMVLPIRTGLLKASLKLTLGLAVVGFIPFSSIMLFGPGLFTLVFGEEWRTAGLYAAWVALEVYTLFCREPAVSIILVIGIQRQFLIFEIISIMAKILALFIGAIVGKALLAILLSSISGGILNIILILFTNFRILKKENN